VDWILRGIVRREGWFKVLDCLKDGEPRTPRELSSETGMSVSEVCRWLEFLEARDFIARPDESLDD
jgi:DNA-binding IclR family transcriptional regulator